MKFDEFYTSANHVVAMMEKLSDDVNGLNDNEFHDRLMEVVDLYVALTDGLNETDPTSEEGWDSGAIGTGMSIMQTINNTLAHIRNSRLPPSLTAKKTSVHKENSKSFYIPMQTDSIH